MDSLRPNPHTIPGQNYFTKKARGTYGPLENPLGFKSAKWALDYSKLVQESARESIMGCDSPFDSMRDK